MWIAHRLPGWHQTEMAFIGPLEDRIAIRELHDTYADAGFRGDRQAWLDCWARDCCWITTFGERRGKEALGQQWDALWSTLDALAFFAVVGSIEVEGDRAVTRGYVRELAVMKDGPMQKIAGRYDDELVREDGTWKFSIRRYSVLIRETAD